MDQNRQNDTNGEYCFQTLPKNVRQIGETMQKTRFFIEDYVMTFLHKCMEDKKEEGIVLFVGKKGEKEAENCIFIYGAIMAECNVLDGKRALDMQKWKEIYYAVQKYFPQGELFGFGCGVGMWNSQVDQSIQAMQKENFPMENRLLFLADLGEKEEKLFITQKEGLQELTGYWIYFSKNTQMQEYMLAVSPQRSMEGGYRDDVTQNIRKVIHHKKELHYNKRTAVYGMSALLFFLMLFGAFLLFQSTKRIQNLQQTIETLSHSTGDVVSGSGLSAVTQEAATDNADDTQNDTTGNEADERSDTKGKSTDEKESRATDENASPFFSPQHTKEPVSSIDAKESGKADKGTKEKKTTIGSGKIATAAPKKTGTAQSEKTAAASQKTGYRVKAGDTLSQIVWRQYHNLECMAMVRDINHIKDDDKIKEGQFLILPEYED